MSPKTRILIVDDDETVRRAFERILSTDHCDVESASGGRDALQRMAQQAFDVVLLDLRMPGMDGLSVLREIKRMHPDCEVVVITGFPELESAKQSVALGAYDYLAKPVGPQDVIQAANAAMLHKRWAMRPELHG